MEEGQKSQLLYLLFLVGVGEWLPLTSSRLLKHTLEMDGTRGGPNGTGWWSVSFTFHTVSDLGDSLSQSMLGCGQGQPARFSEAVTGSWGLAGCPYSQKPLPLKGISQLSFFFFFIFPLFRSPNFLINLSNTVCVPLSMQAYEEARGLHWNVSLIASPYLFICLFV